MWRVYCWEYFSQNFMSENCRVVNWQHIDTDTDTDREVCLYWEICNMIWKLSWCTYGNCSVNPITKTKIASSSHSPISTKLALLWSALPKCLKLFDSVCVWQVILSPWYYPLHVMCSFGRHHYWYVYGGTILRKLKPFSLMPPKKKSRKILAVSQHFLEVFVEVTVRVKFRRNKLRIFCCLLYYYRQQTATVLYTTGP
jgi:hypothetical protein